MNTLEMFERIVELKLQSNEITQETIDHLNEWFDNIKLSGVKPTFRRLMRNAFSAEIAESISELSDSVDMGLCRNMFDPEIINGTIVERIFMVNGIDLSHPLRFALIFPIMVLINRRGGFSYAEYRIRIYMESLERRVITEEPVSDEQSEESEVTDAE